MVLASEIITSVRDVLSDPSAKRYSNELLLRLLNEGLKNFAIATSFSKQKIMVALEVGISTYDLSSYSINIDRIQYMGRKLPVKSEEEMDKISPDWYNHTGTEPLYIIFSNMRHGTFRIYPTLTESNIVIDQNQVYGGLIDISLNEDIIQLADIADIAFSVPYYLVVFCTAIPTKVVALTDEIMLSAIHIPAITAYVSGQAFRVDQDAQNRSIGAEQLTIYNDYVLAAKANDQTANNSAATPTIPYIGFQ